MAIPIPDRQLNRFSVLGAYVSINEIRRKGELPLEFEFEDKLRHLTFGARNLDVAR